MADIHLYLGQNGVEHLLQYCEEHQLRNFLLVADKNTYPVLGQAVETALKGRGWDVKSRVFSEHEVVPDEAFIFQVLLEADAVERTYLAVGSGTLTDITRFASHRNRRPFISIPTAPSVDGFTSPSAALVVGRVKQTVMAQPPVAVFGDLPILSAAPQRMIAAGFGDILGKAVAQGDWRLGRLLWNEPYSEEIAARVWKTLQAVIEAAPEIGQASQSGVEKLMFSLIDSGFCMLDFGNSRPASGAEHYMSHVLEMKLLEEGRPAVLHGAKVGLCSIYVAGLYEQLRQMSREEAARRLKAAIQPDREAEIACIRKVYGPIADRLVVEQAPYLNLSPAAYNDLKESVLANWDKIQVIAASVPTPQRFIELLHQAGGATTPGELGLSEDEVHRALVFSHYLRNRFTVRKLGRLLGLVEEGYCYAS